MGIWSKNRFFNVCGSPSTIEISIDRHSNFTLKKDVEGGAWVPLLDDHLNEASKRQMQWRSKKSIEVLLVCALSNNNNNKTWIDASTSCMFTGDMKENKYLNVHETCPYTTTSMSQAMPLSSTFHTSSLRGTSFLEKCTSIKARATCCFSAANKPEGHIARFFQRRNHRKVVLPLEGLCLEKLWAPRLII